jgi:hypothetical protein
LLSFELRRTPCDDKDLKPRHIKPHPSKRGGEFVFYLTSYP